MFLVDTNVFAYSINSAAPESARCRAAIEAWRAGPEPWAATWAVFYEFLRIATHPRVLRQPFTATEAGSYVDAVLASPSFRILAATERHPEFLRRTLHEIPLLAGNVLHDVHTAVVMREHGVRRTYTRDTDFHRFPFLEVIDPMTVGGN